VSRGREGGGPTHCPEPPTWRGTFRARNGRRYTLEACEGAGRPRRRPPKRPAGDPLLTLLLGLAGVVAGFVLTALARARKVDGSWEDRGLWAIFGGFGLVMVGVVLAIATAE
jgi:hypothetical protein